MYWVIYLGGESRKITGLAVDYMLVNVADQELYTEIEPDFEDEDSAYTQLRLEIIRQAKEAGIDPTLLRFPR